MTEFFIPTNTPSSKNSKVWTGKFFVVSAATRKWRVETKKVWQEHKDEFIRLTKDLGVPIFVHMTFIRKSRQLFDYVNPAQTILDEMVMQDWINDDNAELIVPIFGKFRYDKTNPGCIIRVLKEKPKYEFL